MPPDVTLEGGRCSDLLVDSLEDKQLICKINAYPPDRRYSPCEDSCLPYDLEHVFYGQIISVRTLNSSDC